MGRRQGRRLRAWRRRVRRDGALGRSRARSAARRSRRRASCARDSGGHAPIVVLSPLQPGEEIEAGGLEIVVSSLEDYARLRAAGVSCAVHVKADTGMGRWGMAPADALAVGRELAGGNGPLRLAGVMSHLATADDDPAFAAVQTAVFAVLAREFPPCPRHLANSAAALTLPDTHFDAVRCGIALYGVSPFDRDPAEHGLRPALRWTSRVAGLRDLAPGTVCRLRPAPDRRRARCASPTCPWATPTAIRASPAGAPTCSCAGAAAPSRRPSRWISSRASSTRACTLGDEVVLIGVQGDERITAEELAVPRRDDRLRDRVRDRAGRAPRPPHLRRRVTLSGRRRRRPQAPSAGPARARR